MMDDEIPPLQGIADFERETERELAGPNPLHPITPVSLKGLTIPVREWIVPEWLPVASSPAFMATAASASRYSRNSFKPL